MSSSEITALEQRIAQSDLNAVVDLLRHAKTAKSAKAAELASLALHRVFTDFLKKGRVLPKAQGKEDASAQKIRLWLSNRYQEYIAFLGSALSSRALSYKHTLQVLIDLVKVESEALIASAPSKAYKFAGSTFASLVSGLLSATALPDELKTRLADSYLNHYDDIRYYFLKEAASQCAAFDGASNLPEKLLSILEQVTSMPSEPSHLNRFLTTTIAKLSKNKADGQKRGKKRKRQEDTDPQDGSTGIFDSSSSEEEEAQDSKEASAKLPDLLSVRAHKRVFQQCWMSLLPLLTTEEQVKRVLVIMHKFIVPHLQNPASLMDFLSDCCRHGGTVALLALNGLYQLIIRYNLDYPSFYKQLYALLDRQVLHVRYRPRFFRMLDIFLSSSLVPVIMIASFLKRLSRLSLSAPPAALITIIPFTYNLLKKHPQLVQLIHSPPPEDASEAEQLAADPFVPDEADPMRTFALDSSLWELASLSKHYLSSVATLAKIFQNPLSKPSYEMEDFLDHTYTSLFETEANRVVKMAPALDLPPIAAKKTAFFPVSEEKDAPWADEVTEMWLF